MSVMCNLICQLLHSAPLFLTAFSLPAVYVCDTEISREASWGVRRRSFEFHMLGLGNLILGTVEPLRGIDGVGCEEALTAEARDQVW